MYPRLLMNSLLLPMSPSGTYRRSWWAKQHTRIGETGPAIYFYSP